MFRILIIWVWDTPAPILSLNLPSSMKTILFAATLALGILLGTDTGGGTTAPKGGVLDVAAAETGGGTTAPKGGVLDIAATETGGGTTAPKGGVLDIA